MNGIRHSPSLHGQLMLLDGFAASQLSFA
jgi:hypothetical protein